MTDFHVCPEMSGPVPHVGGPVFAPCEPTVLIGGLPAARQGDSLICVGNGPDTIATGADNVLIGGQPAARFGDTTEHGGVIVMGCFTVLIGEGSGGSNSNGDNNNDSSDDSSNSDSNSSSDDNSAPTDQQPQEELKATAYSLDDPNAPPAVDVSDQVDPDPQLTNIPSSDAASTDASVADAASNANSTSLTGEVQETQLNGGVTDSLGPSSGGGFSVSGSSWQTATTTLTGTILKSPPPGGGWSDQTPLNGQPSSSMVLKASAEVDVERGQVLGTNDPMQRFLLGVLYGNQGQMQEIADKDAAALFGGAKTYSLDTQGAAVETFGKKLGESTQDKVATVLKEADIFNDYQENLREIDERNTQLKEYLEEHKGNADAYVVGNAAGRDLGNTYRGLIGIFTNLEKPNVAKAEKAGAEATEKRLQALEKAAEEAKAHPGAASAAQTLEGDPVNAATGEVTEAQTDFTLPGPLALTWSRYWTSRSPIAGELGVGWHHSFDLAVRPLDEAGFGVRLGDGRVALFPPLRDGAALCTQEKLYLVAIGNGFRLFDYDGTSYYFGARTADGFHHLAAVADANDNSIAVYRDNAGGLIGLVDAAGRHIAMTRDDEGRITSVLGPHPQLAEQPVVLAAYAYDANGDLIQAAGPSGHPFRYTYENHLIVETAWPAGLMFRFGWDNTALGHRARCVETVGSGGLHRVALTFDVENQTTTAVRANGGVVHYQWNRQGLVEVETDPVGGRVLRQWSDQGQLLRLEDQAGQAVIYRYDALGRLSTIEDTGRGVAELHYVASTPGAQPLGRIERAVSPEGDVHVWAYDERGNIVTYRDPTGREQRVVRDTRGLPLAILDRSGVVARFVWSDTGALLAKGTERNARVHYEYDLLGRVVAFRRGSDGPTRFRLDAAGQVTEVMRPDGARTELTYNVEGRIVSHRNAAGSETRWRYDGLPTPVERQGADGSTVRYVYDLELNLVAVENQTGARYVLNYDLAGRRTGETGFDGRSISYRYDEQGHLAEQIDAGLSTRYVRDRKGRLLQKHLADGSTHTFAWTSAGALALAANDEARIEFVYDAAGRLTAELRNGQALSHQYDARGRRILTALPDGRLLQLAYAEGEEVSGVSFDGTVVARFAYDAAGREVERLTGTVRAFQEFDPQGRLSRQWGAFADGASAFGRSYTYDASDLLRGVTDSVRGTRTFAYDGCERLLSVDGQSPEHFVIDLAQNTLPAALGANIEGDRLLTYGDRQFSYDAWGNRSAQSSSIDRRHYWYDTEHQLIAVDQLSSSGRSRTSFGYDALGRRTWKRFETAPATDATGAPSAAPIDVTTRFYWTGDRLLAESNDPRDPFAIVYLFEQDSFRPLAQIRRGAPSEPGQVLTYQLDHAGVPQTLLNQAGAWVWAAEFSAFGQLVRKFEETVPNPWRFQGQYHDVETGLSYSQYRYYSPEEARFIQQDPIRLAGGINFSSYVPNPIQWADPLGLAFQNVAGDGAHQLGVNMGQYSYTNPGPLPEGVATTFTGTRYTAVQTQTDLTLYRAGVSGTAFGGYYTKTPPVSALQTRIDSAVKPVWSNGAKSPIDTSYAITFPKGTMMYVGEASNQGGFYVGGTEQIAIMHARSIQGATVLGSSPLK